MAKYRAVPLTASLTAIEQLKEEMLQMQTVNFKKYADIIVNLQINNANKM